MEKLEWSQIFMDLNTPSVIHISLWDKILSTFLYPMKLILSFATWDWEGWLWELNEVPALNIGAGRWT